MSDGGDRKAKPVDDDGLDDQKATESLRAKKNWRQLKANATAFGILGGDREASLSDMLAGPEKANTTFKDVVGTVQLLRGGHEAIRKATNKETESLLLAQSEMVKDMGLVAILQRFRGAYKNSSFGAMDMFRTWWWYVKQDRLLVALTFIFLLSACTITFWAPEWISVTMRIIFNNPAGHIPLMDFCGWLFLYVAIVAIVWAATWSLLFIMQRHFSQRMKWHVAVVGTEKEPQCKAVSSMLNLDELTRTDLPFANTFFFHVIPLCFCASVSVIMGFCMIFYMSWLVGMCAILLFLGLAIVSAIYDDVAMTKYTTNDAKVAKEADLWAIIHDEECSEDSRNEAAAAIMELANEKVDQTLGIKHVLMGVFYRLLTLSVPVFFFLVAGKTVISKYLDEWEVVACAVYFFYMTMWAGVITSCLTSSHQQLGAALRLTLFVNGTNQSLNPKVAFSLPKLNRIRVQQQWGLMSLLAAGILTTIGVCGFLFSGHSTTSCPAVPYTCTMSTTVVDWRTQLTGSLGQSFNVASGCAFTQSTDDLLFKCAEELSEQAPRDIGLIDANIFISFNDWKGGVRAYSTVVRFDTGLVYGMGDMTTTGRRLLQAPGNQPTPAPNGGSQQQTGDKCNPNPCLHGGRCIPVPPQFFDCNCTGTGFTNSLCDVPIDNGDPGPTDNATHNASNCLNNMTNTTGAPTFTPTLAPTPSPTPRPTRTPTTALPTSSPTWAPTNAPTPAPTPDPTESPTTRDPTSAAPTLYPTYSPTASPTNAPTRSPTRDPTESPTFTPTEDPTRAPTSSAPTTAVPSGTPTPPPTGRPTNTVLTPTTRPTTSAPTFKAPTSKAPTKVPTLYPTKSPTARPTVRPSTSRPTPNPTKAPTTKTPTARPTTRTPTTRTPTTARPTTRLPTRAPSTRAPTKPPTKAPTRCSRDQEYQLQLALTVLRLRILIFLRIDSLSGSQNLLRNRRLCNTGKLLWFSEIIFSTRDTQEETRYANRVAQCVAADKAACGTGSTSAACIARRQTQREQQCLALNEGEVPDAADCTDRGLTFDRIKPTTCFECARAVCVTPGPQDILGGNPDAIVTVGTVLLGNPMAVKDQSMWYGRVGAAFDNFVVYVCGPTWEPLEIDMATAVWIGGFALNGWNGGFELKPDSWKFEATNDGRNVQNRNWEVLALMDDDQWYTGERNKGYPFQVDQIKSVVPRVAFRYYRVNAQCSQSVTPLLVENIALYALPSGVPAPAPGPGGNTGGGNEGGTIVR